MNEQKTDVVIANDESEIEIDLVEGSISKFV